MNDKSKNQKHMRLSKNQDSKIVIPAMCLNESCIYYHKFTKFNCIHTLEDSQDCIYNRRSLYERKA